MTLLEGKKGGLYQVGDISGDPQITRRLEALGILEGTKVEILNQKKSGATIIKVRGTRWALGEDIARGIEAKEWAND